MAVDDGTTTAAATELAAAQLVRRAEQAGYDRGVAEAQAVAMGERAAQALLRAQAAALTALAGVLGSRVQSAADALSGAAALLRDAADELGA